MPWKLMASMGAYIFTWLIGYSGLMGAIAGILICDYWVIRKQRLNLEGLFDPSGPTLRNGFNWRAIVALIVAIAPVVPDFFAQQQRRAARSAIRPSSITCTLMHGSLLLPWDSAYTTF